MIEYPFKTTPYDHQRKIFSETCHKTSHALFMEQGTGKTKVTIDTAGWLYLNGDIDALVVFAPLGVHTAWHRDELPTHMSDKVPYEVFVWDRNKWGTKIARARLNKVLVARNLAVFIFNTDAVRSPTAQKVINEIFKKRRVMAVLDESTAIKNPKAQRTKNFLKIGKVAKYRRILSGTPITNAPFDIYPQMAFLDPDILGFKSYYSFRNYYGEFEMSYGSGQRQYPSLIRYRNLEKLTSKVGRHSSRVLKSECMDLPEKIYQKRYFTLDAKEADAYMKIRDEVMLELDNGRVYEANLAIVILRKLVQITGGFIIVDAGVIQDLGTSRLACLKDAIMESNEKTIVWAHHRYDIQRIVKMLGEADVGATYIDGSVKGPDREEALRLFRTDPGYRVLVANPHTAGHGLTITEAKVVIYYNNDFSLETRLQSEDRAHRIGQDKNVVYIDIVAEDTLDEKIIDALRNKRDIAKSIVRDGMGSWI